MRRQQDRWQAVDVVAVADEPGRRAAASSKRCQRCGEKLLELQRFRVTVRNGDTVDDQIVCPVCARVAELRRDGVAPRRVLIVDDDPIYRDVTRRWIEMTGVAEVIGFASDGKDAHGQIARTAPDTIVLDMLMPRATGDQLLTELPADLDVVVVSASEPMREEAIRLRPDALVLDKRTTSFDRLVRHLAGLATT
ncbi:response regulator transcription factor [Egicoccus sp. AB-alg2]|uniref:response regulator transcription factor n=1 Tax=Egicoccus sp. AB-alg2 TaxID=3242693 RepID=UPI00359EEB38